MQTNSLRHVTFLRYPCVWEALGVRSAFRMAAASYWASWVDALKMISERIPAMATRVTHRWTGDVELGGCLGKLQIALHELDWSGFVSRPSWEALKLGAGPPTAWFTEPDEWQHGWQHHASSCYGYPVRETVLAQSRREPGSFEVALGSLRKFGVVRIAHIARVRSQTAPLPYHHAGTVAPPTESRCPCRAALHVRGQHKAACPPIRETSFMACAHEAPPCPSVSRGGRHSEIQHQTVGHEPQRPRHRRTGDQGSGVGASGEPRCPALQIQPDHSAR